MIKPTNEMIAEAIQAHNATGAYGPVVDAVLAIVERDYWVTGRFCGAKCPEDPEEICELPTGHDGGHRVDVLKVVTW